MESGFNQIGTGEIPEDWQVARLGDEKIAKVIMGQSPPSSTYNESAEGLPFLQGNAEFGETYPAPSVYTSNPLKIAEKDDVLVSVRAPVGEVNLSPFRCCIGRGLSAIRPNPSRLDYRFVFYYLRHAMNRLLTLATGSTFTAVRKEDLASFWMAIPPLPEQLKIASILSTVDDAIQKTDEIIAKTQQLKKGLMQQLLTRGIGHTKFKQTEIGEIPEEWEVLRLDDILLDVRYGTSVRANIEGRGFPVLGIPNILTGEIDESNLRHVELPESQRKALALGDGDILVVRTNANPEYVGRSALFAKRNGLWLFASYLIRLRSDTARVVPLYLAKLLQTEAVRKSFLQIARTSAGNYNINTQGIRSITVSLPPIEEQKQIVSGLSVVDDRMRNERQRKKELGDLKKGLMQILLTGKVRVEVD